MKTEVFFNSSKDAHLWSLLPGFEAGRKVVLGVLARVSGLETQVEDKDRDERTVVVAKAENGRTFSVDIRIDVVEKTTRFTCENEEYWFSHETDSTHSSRSMKVVKTVPLTQELIEEIEESLRQKGKIYDSKRWKESCG